MAERIEALVVFAPDDHLKQQIDRWVQQLGHPNFREREEAQRQLQAHLVAAMAPLRHALLHEDPEVSSRARALTRLWHPEQQSERLSDLLRWLAEVPQPETTSLLFELLKRYGQEILRPVQNALLTNFQETEQGALNAALKSKDPLVQRSGVLLTSFSNTLENRQHLRPWLHSRDPHLRLAAARGLAIRAAPDCVPILVELQKEEDSELALESQAILSHLFQHDLASNETWTAWIESRPKGAKLEALPPDAFPGLLHTRWRVVSSEEAKLDPAEWNFRPNGRLKIVNGSDHTDNDTWKVKGSQLIVRQNDYVTYTGRVVGFNRIEGTALNIRDVRWTWVAKRLHQTDEDGAGEER